MRRGDGRSKISLIVLTVLAAVTLAVVGFAVTMKPAQPPVSEKVANYTPPPPKVITPAIFFGDSWFNGSYPVTEKETFASIAAYKLGYEPLIRGNGGTGFLAARTDSTPAPPYAAQIKGGELKSEMDVKPPLVVIEGGLLDQRYEPEEITAAVAGVLKSAKGTYPKAKVVLVGPADIYTPESPGIAKVNEAMTVAADAEGVPMIHMSDLVSRKELLGMIGKDKIHPTAAGHKLLGERLAAKLTKLGVPTIKS